MAAKLLPLAIPLFVSLACARQAPVRVPAWEQARRLLYFVAPQYPPLAKMARITGPVRLEALIDENGAVERLRFISGHPLLVPAVLRANQTLAVPAL